VVINPGAFEKFLEPVFVKNIIIGFQQGKKQGFAKAARPDKKQVAAGFFNRL
jgi:hypothetical protein